MAERYSIYRYFIRDGRYEPRFSGLEWREVAEILSDPETKFDYATTDEARAITEEHGPWWDLWMPDEE